MTETKMDNRCRACREPLVFAKMESTGKSAPFDAQANLLLGAYTIEDGVARFVPKEQRRNLQLYVSHFATCTNPEDFRKRGRK